LGPERRFIKWSPGPIAALVSAPPPGPLFGLFPVTASRRPLFTPLPPLVRLGPVTSLPPVRVDVLVVVAVLGLVLLPRLFVFLVLLLLLLGLLLLLALFSFFLRTR
jgi:hypothetical protein